MRTLVFTQQTTVLYNRVLTRISFRVSIFSRSLTCVSCGEICSFESKAYMKSKKLPQLEGGMLKWKNVTFLYVPNRLEFLCTHAYEPVSYRAMHGSTSLIYICV